MRKLGRIALRVAVAFAVLLVVCGIAGLLVVRSGWFHERVRERIIAEIEKATGGRVELGIFGFDWRNLTATVAPLVLHGQESLSEPPLFSAQSVKAGLKIVSMLERKVDLATLRVEQPRVRIVFYPDGSTNLLTPHLGNWTEELLNIAVRHYEAVDGVLEYDDRQIPLNLRGDDLLVRMVYDAAGPRYRGDLASRHVRVMAGGLAPIEVDASAVFALDKSGVDLKLLHLATKESYADLVGKLNEVRAPHGTLAIKAAGAVREAVALFQLPVDRTGTAGFDGKLTVAFTTPFEFAINGRVTARGIGYRRDRLKIEGAEVRADLRLTPDQVTLRGVTLTALGSAITGQADLAKWKNLHFEGKFEGLGVQEAAKMATDRRILWNGTLSGEIAGDAVLGESTAKLQVNANITPAAEGAPIEGRIDVVYDQAAGLVKLSNSYLATPATRLELAGTLGETLQVRAESTNLDDLLSALAMATDAVPKQLPLKLRNGRAAFSGTIAGTIDDPRLSGRATVTSASFDGHAFDQFTGDLEASRHSIRFEHLLLARGSAGIQGSAQITPRDGKFEDGVVDARLNVRNAQLAELANEAGVTIAITGTAAATVHLFGSVSRPEAEIAVQVEKPAGFGEQLDRVRANLRYSPSGIVVTAGQADGGSGKLLFQGGYQHRADDWKNGDVRFDLTAQGVSISRVKAFSELQSGVDGRLDGKTTGTARLVNGELTLTSVSAEASLRGVTLDHDSLGDISLSAETRGADVAIRATAKVRDATLQGEGSWRLEGDHPGSATMRFSRITLATLHSLAVIGGTVAQQEAVPPFDGFVEGRASLSMALRKPRDFRAEVTLDTVQLNPKPTQTLRLNVQPQDVELKNSQPVVVEISSKEARIRSAQFTGRDTSLEAAGGVPFDAKTGADLTVRGSINLVILQLLNPDLAARGNATVQASIRGSLRDPQLNGRMELKNASLYLSDLPNGVDSASGALVFDRNRATIENLTAETGGGKVTFAGFIEFGSVMVYRLQAEAQNVRVRYPEDVSVTFTASLALNGASDSSTVSGMVTLNRASFTPRADLAQILAQTTKPTPAPVGSSEYVRGMQFDVRIESGPNFELQTSLTRNVEAEVDLRLRGTPLRPVLLGTASINQGDVQVFGNRYSVNRGDIRFLNPVKIDPIFDMDLETKARGITVNIALSGTLQKLNVNYSSDPPMQPREIIALLAVGRAPTGTAGLNSNQPTAGSTSLAEAGGSLLGQAVSAQLSSRLQRFFGASRVKIDPTLTGVAYLPQARLTIEQQVSKDITLTYITNLNRTQEQIVQIEWGFSRQWSAIAVREANGLFGIDFQYRKRFK